MTAYAKWIDELHARLSELHRRHFRMRPATLERELATLKGFYQHVLAYAEQHDLDLDPYYSQLSDISFFFEDIQAFVEDGRELPSLLREVRRYLPTCLLRL